MTAYSDLPFDAIYYICVAASTLDSQVLRTLSLVDQRTREACIPFLFKHIIFDSQYGDDSVLWERLEAEVENLLGNETILKAVRSFHLEPRLSSPKDSAIPKSLFTFIFSLKNLSSLSVLFQPDYFVQVKKEFNVVSGGSSRQSFRLLPNLQHLTIRSPGWMFIGESAPNLTSLDIKESAAGHYPWNGITMDVARVGRLHPNLTSLHCVEVGWTSAIEEIATHLPKIQSLGLYAHAYGDAIVDHVNAYQKLKHLESLSFPEATSLGMGFHPAGCGNAYRSNPGLREKVNKQRIETVNRLMHGVETHVMNHGGSTLREVIIGSKWGYWQTVWEKGNDGKLHETKVIRRAPKTSRVTAVEHLCDAKNA